ncbi:MAG: hypothetical protein ACXACA_00540, partial [Candidatus Ranarchaeia archaeon]
MGSKTPNPDDRRSGKTVIQSVVKPNTFRDSVALMKITEEIITDLGLEDAALVMGTPLNQEFLKDANLWTTKMQNAGPNDLIIVVKGDHALELEQIINEIDERLQKKSEVASQGEITPYSIEGALRLQPDSNLVLISVPGEYAVREAEVALNQNLNVFIFSSNVSLEDELRLKKMAKTKGLLCMGPDCGTALINKVAIGFGNVVRSGKVGIVAAAGTGLQHVASLIHQYGEGISHAIGTGGRDLKKEIGGLTTLEGLQLLKEDPSTEVIVVVSKPPHPKVAKHIVNVAEKLGKPVVVNFLGSEVQPPQNQVVFTPTLESTAIKATNLLKNKQKTEDFKLNSDDLQQRAQESYSQFSQKQKYMRGVYSGGTLYYEGMWVFRQLVGEPWALTPFDTKRTLKDPNSSKEHTFV